MFAQLQKLLNKELTKFEHNGVVFQWQGDQLHFSATGLFITPTEFTLNDTQLCLLRRFINTFDTDEYDTYLVKLDGRIRLVAENEFEQNELDLNEDGSADVLSGWRSSDYWDKWTVSSDGNLEYAGTVEGYRRVPEWLTASATVQSLRH